MPSTTLTARQREVLEIIEQHMRERGYPPSVRDRRGRRPDVTVHGPCASGRAQRRGHCCATRTKPRAIEVRWDLNSDAAIDRRPVRHVPLVGDVAAGTNVLAQENVEEVLPLPADFTGEGDLFMLRVRGDSMIEAGILDGDFVVSVAGEGRERQHRRGRNPGDEATVKTFTTQGKSVVLVPANPRLEPMEFAPEDVNVFGRVVTVMRRL